MMVALKSSEAKFMFQNALEKSGFTFMQERKCVVVVPWKTTGMHI